MSLGIGLVFCLQHVNHVEFGRWLPHGGQGGGDLSTVVCAVVELKMFYGVHRRYPLVRHDLQPAQGGHHIEIGIAVQQHVPIRNAITC